MVLAYSPFLEIKDSSRPFLAYLGALLSVIRNVPVQPTIFPTNIGLDDLDEDDEDEEDPVSDSENDSGSEYLPPGNTTSNGNGATSQPLTRSQRRSGSGDQHSELMVLGLSLSRRLTNKLNFESHTGHFICCRFV
jgi:hypothetical protein